MEASSIDTQVVTSGRRNPLHYGLAKRLRTARDAADLGTAQLSLAAGLSSSVAAIIERGGVPHLDTVEKLARVLKVSPCVLAYGVEAPSIEGDVLACEAIGARLRQVREQRSLSRNALGKVAKTTGQTVANIEDKGYTPTVATCEALAKALGVDPCWLAFGQGTAPDLPPQGTA